MKKMKINDNTNYNLSRIIRKSFITIGIVLSLILFQAIADEETNSDKTDETVVEKVEEKSSEQNQSQEDKKVSNKDETKEESEEKPANIKKEVIIGSCDETERDLKKGITILIGNAKTIRQDEDGNEIGFLNADKITLISDLDTGETKEIIAVGNVEIRDDKIFATCDHATMDNLTNIITLKDNVVVLQNNDRLETKLFTFNRITGKQTGVGNVKFRVTVTQTVPAEAEDSAEEGEDSSETSDEGEKKTTKPESIGDKEKESEETEPESADDKEKESEETDKNESSTKTETSKEEDESAESEENESTESEENETTEPEENGSAEPEENGSAESEEDESTESEEDGSAEPEENGSTESEEEDQEETP